MTGLIALPDAALDLWRILNALPRLRAHLILIHDAVWHLMESLARLYPDLRVDADEVLFGAATHDLGKSLHPEELLNPSRQIVLVAMGFVTMMVVPVFAVMNVFRNKSSL